MFLLDQSSLPFIILVFLLSGVCLYCAGTESNTINYITLVLIILILLFILFLLWNIFIFFIYYEFLVIILFISLFLFIASFFKVRSAFYFFIFSLFGSIFFFYVIAVLPIIIKIVMINSAIIFSLPFLVKLPSFPFSYWLPEVHTEANTSISLLLAGLILKLGIFGIMRYCYITFDLFFSIINSGLLTLTLIIILIIMCSFFRFAYDLKKIIAFSSITHLNLTFSALITLNNSGILTAIITSFAHGLSSVALFLFVGSVIARTYSRNIDSLFFLDFQSRVILLFLLLFNLSFPLTLNFIGELLAVVSLVSVSSFFAFIFMLSSLVFTLFWFFIYNRKLSYYPIRLHLYSIEKFITIWLCVLLMSSGIFFILLFPFSKNKKLTFTNFSRHYSSNSPSSSTGASDNDTKEAEDYKEGIFKLNRKQIEEKYAVYLESIGQDDFIYSMFMVHKRWLKAMESFVGAELIEVRNIPNSDYVYVFVRLQSEMDYLRFNNAFHPHIFYERRYATYGWANIYWKSVVAGFLKF